MEKEGPLLLAMLLGSDRGGGSQSVHKLVRYSRLAVTWSFVA
jgi:hypothetical protein